MHARRNKWEKNERERETKVFKTYIQEGRDLLIYPWNQCRIACLDIQHKVLIHLISDHCGLSISPVLNRTYPQASRRDVCHGNALELK